jgi:hypothetical protein
VEDRSPDDLAADDLSPERALSAFPASDFLAGPVVSLDPDFSPDPDVDFSDDPFESPDSVEVELLARESVT